MECRFEKINILEIWSNMLRFSRPHTLPADSVASRLVHHVIIHLASCVLGAIDTAAFLVTPLPIDARSTRKLLFWSLKGHGHKTCFLASPRLATSAVPDVL